MIFLSVHWQTLLLHKQCTDYTSILYVHLEDSTRWQCEKSSRWEMSGFAVRSRGERYWRWKLFACWCWLCKKVSNLLSKLFLEVFSHVGNFSLVNNDAESTHQNLNTPSPQPLGVKYILGLTPCVSLWYNVCIYNMQYCYTLLYTLYTVTQLYKTKAICSAISRQNMDVIFIPKYMLEREEMVLKDSGKNTQQTYISVKIRRKIKSRR